MPRSLPHKIVRLPLKLGRVPVRAARHVVASAALPRLRATFVLSTGRVGTDTLAHLLSRAPELIAVHEPAPRLFPETRQAYVDAPLDDRRARDLLVLAGCGRARLWADCLLRGKRYVETSNRMTYLADALLLHMPHSQFIFLHRHPGEVVRSGMRRGYYDHHRWDADRIAPRPEDPAAQFWQSWSPFERNCWYWHAVNRLGLEFVARHPDRCFTLRSSELFDAEPGSLSALGRFLGLKRPEGLAPASAAPRNAQQKGEFARYGAWSHEQRETLRRIAGDTAERLGYPLN
jgi:hypothetical protein